MDGSALIEHEQVLPGSKQLIFASLIDDGLQVAS